MQLYLSWAHRGVKINLLKLYNTLKIYPRIENYQNCKNSSQILHEEGNKSLKNWRSLPKPRRRNGQQKLDLAVFSIFV